MPRPPRVSTLFPYTTLFRSLATLVWTWAEGDARRRDNHRPTQHARSCGRTGSAEKEPVRPRSEEHTSELQSRGHLVCRLLLEKKKRRSTYTHDEAHEAKSTT